MSNKQENTFTAPSSSISSAKKHKSTIVVRQTLTSKLRAERGDKLQFLKNQLQVLSDKQSKISCNSSKESLSSVDKFNKTMNPLFDSNIKTLSQKSEVIGAKTTSANKLSNKPWKPSTSINRFSKVEIKANKPNDNKMTVSNWQSIKKSAPSISNKPTFPKPNTFSLIPNRIQASGKFSLLPNQIKATLPKLDDKSNKRQTLMSYHIKKQKPIVLNKQVPSVPVPVNNAIRKPALKKANSISSSVKKSVTVQSPMRKSLTAMHFKRVSNCNRGSTIHRTMSWSDGLSPCKEMDNYKSPIFRTPSMARRRSVAFQTPLSIGKKSISPFTVISTPTTSDLKRRLGLWLEKKGKPLDAFHHLRCFGINSTVEIDDENKENFEVFIPEKNSSYENLKITPEKNKKTVDDIKNNVSVANDAMYDLHKLILEGYPREQCEAWLDLICSKFQEVQEKPQYWECRAALEETRGNYQSALDCYSNAIAIGAEVEKVNEPLDNLLEKFSVLNINHSETSKPSKAVLEVRNVFKSSIINFAIQERSKKDLEDGCRYSATPVRRSTRRSRIHYVTRDDVKLCTTLDDLDSSVRDSLHFQTNRGFKH